jgi:PTH2 family peptidyl-tRNA hydrolase
MAVMKSRYAPTITAHTVPARHPPAGAGRPPVVSEAAGRAVYGVPMAMKLVLVVRADLGMGRGKIAAQVAHAAVAATLAGLRRGDGDLAAWLQDGQPKVVLKVPGLEQLEEIAGQARAAGLPVEVICDAGRTQLEPGTTTCCAVGPAEASRIDAVTGALSLL